jgi:hypothetical protein
MVWARHLARGVEVTGLKVWNVPCLTQMQNLDVLTQDRTTAQGGEATGPTRGMYLDKYIF